MQMANQYPRLPPASPKRPRGRHPLLAPTRLLPLHHIPRARRAQRALPRSRSSRRDSCRRTAIPHLLRHSLVQSPFHKQHRSDRLRRPRSAHAPIPHRSRSGRHQAHIRAHSVRLPQYCVYSAAILPMPSSARSSFASQLSRTVILQTFPYRHVDNQRPTSVWLGPCVTPERNLKKLCGGRASMLSAPHAFGISGKAGSGGRVNSDSRCLLDCEFPNNLLSLG
jgi:hypothetical protein